MVKTLCTVIFSVSVVVAVIGVGGCTANQRAKKLGGTFTQQMPKGQKIFNATWKEDSLWVLTEPMSANDVPKTYEFKEYSPYGMLEGKVVLVEVK